MKQVVYFTCECGWRIHGSARWVNFRIKLHDLWRGGLR